MLYLGIEYKLRNEQRICSDLSLYESMFWVNVYLLIFYQTSKNIQSRSLCSVVIQKTLEQLPTSTLYRNIRILVLSMRK